MKHVVVDVAEEGGIHQIRGRYGEIQDITSPTPASASTSQNHRTIKCNKWEHKASTCCWWGSEG